MAISLGSKFNQKTTIATQAMASKEGFSEDAMEVEETQTIESQFDDDSFSHVGGSVFRSKHTHTDKNLETLVDNIQALNKLSLTEVQQDDAKAGAQGPRRISCPRGRFRTSSSTNRVQLAAEPTKQEDHVDIHPHRKGLIDSYKPTESYDIVMADYEHQQRPRDNRRNNNNYGPRKRGRGAQTSTQSKGSKL